MRRGFPDPAMDRLKDRASDRAKDRDPRPEGLCRGRGGGEERGEPAARQVFDLPGQFHDDGTTLTSLREPRAAEETGARFFLYLVPADPASLPENARGAGFDDRDFAFPGYGSFLDGERPARVPLPPYAILRLRTGQFVTDGGRLREAEVSSGDRRRRD